MRTARTVARGTLSFDEIAEPQPRAGHARVRIHAVSLCGTDLHIFDDDFPTQLPLVQGHEMSGTVIDTDPAAAFSRGERVAIDPLVACGDCPACRRGRSHVCPHLSVRGCYEDGGFAEVVSVPVDRLHRVPDDLALDAAALGEPASISLQAVARAGAQPGETALVLGCGPIGLLATLGLTERGVTVVAADTDAERISLAREFGAAHALRVADGFPDDEQRALLSALTDGAGPDVVIEATGVPASLENAVRLIAAGGRIVQVGISPRPARITVKDLTDKEIELHGSRNSRGLIPDGLAMLARHPAATAALLTHRFPFSDLPEAFRTMADPSIPTGKILVLLSAETEATA
ncbi:alcohol dehydrogenase catalytic domain-containing protein [Microbacterium hominis]|uniref:alcohol dehydrogenase catalytic domain-containing protein n=1 Tax=Microbacterium TaxID=33882 RepID=UPI00168AB87F|nr:MULTISPECIES: alcohol dehydrogenase catalytic domain-containing protein [Microbacterium]QOC24874.1 alcohol dehydrogenase catalytic domain-containing protein [Microbacterium hominis]QOC28926.1 alcohol dehydrogenase catalytic domain-containing protein [Microbacterium hominis]QYF98871.1 alcohol dehydrogenase catalytic domain-containing protein [Microbacterium sp. PAMC21962]